MSEGNKSGKIGGTDKTVLIVVIVGVVLFALIPLAFVAFILFFVAKPIVDTGINHLIETSSGNSVSSVYSRSLQNIYDDATAGQAISYSDCQAFESLVYDEADENISFCSSGVMTLSIQMVERGIQLDARGDDGAVSFVFNNRFTAYYKLVQYDTPMALSGNFKSYELVNDRTRLPGNLPANDEDANQENSEQSAEAEPVIY